MNQRPQMLDKVNRHWEQQSMDDQNDDTDSVVKRDGRFSFSIFSVFVLIAIVAVAIVAVSAFGPVVIWFAFHVLAVFSIAASIRAEREIYVVQCVLAYLFLGYHLPTVGHYTPGLIEILFGVSLTAFGAWLSINCIRRGHWSTKLFAIIPAILYGLIIGSAIWFGLTHQDQVIDYWLRGARWREATSKVG